MNKQANYIIYAFLVLLTASCVYLFIERISSTKKPNISTYNIDFETKTDFSGKEVIGKDLFMSKCASCHQVLRNATGPALAGFEDRGPWADRNNVYEWIKNPATFMSKNKYTQELKEMYGSMMTAFPELTNEEIDAIIEYLNNRSMQKSTPIKVD